MGDSMYNAAPEGDAQASQQAAMSTGHGVSTWERAFPCVKLRGLPYDVLEDDVRSFLAGCEPVDILMAKREGRFCGEAYALLGTMAQVEVAIAKNKTYLGRRYVEVFRAKKLDYYKAIMGEMNDGMSRRSPPPPAYGHPTHMDPYQHHHQQQQMYAGYGHHDSYSHGPAPGMGPSMGGQSSGSGGGSNLVKLRGLPFSVTEGEIRLWFEDPAINPQPVSPTNVYIVSDHGRPSGNAYVEFATAAEVNIARCKDKAMMGNRYVEIFPASRSDLDKHGLGSSSRGTGY